MSTPTAEELLREAKDESYSRWWIVGEEQILAQRLATALARVAELEAEVQHRPTLTHLRCPKCDALPSWLESEGLWCDRGTPTHWIRCRSCGLQIRAVEWDELRQRAEEAEAEAKAVSEHMSTVVLPDLVATADKLAEAQQREAWWREWYILGEMARMIGGAMPEVVERAKELRRILDATEGEK